MSEAVGPVEHEIEGLAIDWITLPEDSSFAGKTLGDGRIRTRTGVSVVAVVRGENTVPAPGPAFIFQAGDVAVAVGTPPGIAEARTILEA